MIFKKNILKIFPPMIFLILLFRLKSPIWRLPRWRVTGGENLIIHPYISKSRGDFSSSWTNPPPSFFKIPPPKWVFLNQAVWSMDIFFGMEGCVCYELVFVGLIKTIRFQDCKRNFKWPYMQRWQSPIHNSTLKSFVWSSMIYILMLVIFN